MNAGSRQREQNVERDDQGWPEEGLQSSRQRGIARHRRHSKKIMMITGFGDEGAVEHAFIEARHQLLATVFRLSLLIARVLLKCLSATSDTLFNCACDFDFGV